MSNLRRLRQSAHAAAALTAFHPLSLVINPKRTVGAFNSANILQGRIGFVSFRVCVDHRIVWGRSCGWQCAARFGNSNQHAGAAGNPERFLTGHGYANTFSITHCEPYPNSEPVSNTDAQSVTNTKPHCDTNADAYPNERTAGLQAQEGLLVNRILTNWD